jgi:hypothetical protein
VLELIKNLCSFATGVVADDNAALFSRIVRDRLLGLFRLRAGDSCEDWLVTSAIPFLGRKAMLCDQKNI